MSANPDVASWSGLAQKYGPRYGIPAPVLLGLIDVESSGNENAVSPTRAFGGTQFEPSTAARYGVKRGDRASQVRGAAQYLRDLGYAHDPLHALGSYNGGPGNPQYGYAHEVMARAKSYGHVSGGGGNGGSQVVSIPGDASSGLTGAQSGISVADLLSALKQQTGVPVSAPPIPQNLQPALALPKGYQAPASAGAPAPQASIADALQLVGQIQGPDVPRAQSPGTAVRIGKPSAPLSGGGNFAYPAGKRGKVIGTPFQGTHAKAFNAQGGSDNWQSENAIDFALPVGTPIYAVEDGTLGNTGSLGQGGRFAGLRTNLIARNNSFYYAHLSKLVVKQGQRVKKGQLLGYSGEANGVAHLHFAQENGDPTRYFG